MENCALTCEVCTNSRQSLSELHCRNNRKYFFLVQAVKISYIFIQGRIYFWPIDLFIYSVRLYFKGGIPTHNSLVLKTIIHRSFMILHIHCTKTTLFTDHGYLYSKQTWKIGIVFPRIAKKQAYLLLIIDFSKLIIFP